MENRHSSPFLMEPHPRPPTHRKRSNSFPIVDALGCSTPEAKLIMAEGRAALRSRRGSMHKRVRRRPSHRDENVYRPRDHLKYLNGDSHPNGDKEPASIADARSTRHARIPSNTTDCSTSTVIAPDQPRTEPKDPIGETPGSPLEDYSATLAQFIKSQLKSIPSYQPHHSPISPRSFPNLSPKLPVELSRKRKGIDSIVEIPPMRPPLQSAFSAWSSTDDEIDEEGELPPLPSVQHSSHNTPASNNYPPSILSFYESSNGSSFLFTSTPLEENVAVTHEEEDPLTAKANTFPDQSNLPGASSPAQSPVQHDDDCPSSAPSTHPQLSLSSAPSLSSTSTASYFDCKPPATLAHVQARIVAAVTPNHKVQHITAVSPFEGNTFVNVPDILVESQQRVFVDGLSFDMLRDFSLPNERMKRVSTPC